MSANISGIEGVSARYAAQIRELLYAQAIKRHKAQVESRRADAAATRKAEAAAAREAAAQRKPDPQPVATERKAYKPVAIPEAATVPKADAKGAKVNTLA